MHEEDILDEALKNGALVHLGSLLVASPHGFYDHELYVRCLHSLISRFLVFFHLKIKGLCGLFCVVGGGWERDGC